MAVRKIKTSWWVDFQFRLKRYRYRSPENTREGALAYEARLRGEVTRYGDIASQKSDIEIPGTISPILEEYVPRWMNGYVLINNRPKEAQQKRSVLNKHLLPMYGKFRLDEITVEHIERYKGVKLGEGLHPKTITNHLLILHKLLVTAKEWRLIEYVPRVKPLKSPESSFRYLSRFETHKLITILPQGLIRSMIILAVRTGLRYSELSALQWEDVDLEKGTITVRRSLVEGKIGNTKNNRIRRIPLTGDAIEELRVMAHRTAYVFQLKGSPVLYKTARTWLQKACGIAMIPIISWHDLRHTFASQLVASNAPLMAVQKLLGHADIKMTMRYSHLGHEELRNAISLLEPQKLSEMSTWCQPESMLIKNPA